MRVALDDVSVEYDGRPALFQVSLSIEDGSWCSLIGPNGAGKSSLLKALAGLICFDGRIGFGDELHPPRGRNHARRVALVPQRPELPPAMRLVDYVLLGRSPYIGYLRAEGHHDLAVVDMVIERLDLGNLAGRRLGELSGGEVQRAVLGRALAQEPAVLLLDEPTSSLDIGHAEDVLELVDELRREHGLTVIGALHDLTTAAAFSDLLVLLSKGHIVAAGDVTSVAREEVLGPVYGTELDIFMTPAGPVVVARRRAKTGSDFEGGGDGALGLRIGDPRLLEEL